MSTFRYNIYIVYFSIQETPWKHNGTLYYFLYHDSGNALAAECVASDASVENFSHGQSDALTHVLVLALMHYWHWQTSVR
jgi:hypothetical protein